MRLWLFAAVLWGLAGCDAQLSQWDRIDVKAGTPRLPALPGADAQPATGTEQGASTSSTGDTTGTGSGGGNNGGSGSGPGATTADTTGSGSGGGNNGGSGPGATTADTTGTGGGTGGSGGSVGGTGTGSGSGTTGGSTGGTTGGSTGGTTGGSTGATTGTGSTLAAPTALITTQGAATNPDERFSPSTDLYFAWSAATGATGAVAYTVTWWPQAACPASAGTTTNLNAATSLSVTGVNGTTYSFRVSAKDQSGAVATSACSGSLTVDTTPPVATLSAAIGARSFTTDLTFTQTTDIADYYSRVDIRRGTAGSPAVCDDALTTGNGPIVQVLTGAAIASGASFTDYTDAGGQSYIYQACIYDLSGTLTNGPTSAAQVTKSEVMFATSLLYTGESLGNLTGADAICMDHAHHAHGGVTPMATVSSEPTWLAFLANSTTNATDRMILGGPITGPLANDPVVAAPSDLFTAAALSPAEFENGADMTLGAPVSAWTGTHSTGARDAANTCSDWSAATSGRIGDAAFGVGTAAWDSGATAACNVPEALYCLSQPEAFLTAAASTDGSGDVALTIALPATIPVSGTVEIYRAKAGAVPACAVAAGVPYRGSVIVAAGATAPFSDAGAAPANAPYTYQACIYDRAGALIVGALSAPVITQ